MFRLIQVNQTKHMLVHYVIPLIYFMQYLTKNPKDREVNILRKLVTSDFTLDWTPVCRERALKIQLIQLVYRATSDF